MCPESCRQGCGEAGLELKLGLTRVSRDLGIRDSVERRLGRELPGHSVKSRTW